MFIKLIYFIHKTHAKSWIMDQLYLSFFWRIIPPAWVFQGLGWMTFSSWIPFWNHIKLLVRSLALSSLFLTTEKREVSSANNLTLDFNPSGKSLIYIRKSKGPRSLGNSRKYRLPVWTLTIWKNSLRSIGQIMLNQIK